MQIPTLHFFREKLHSVISKAKRIAFFLSSLGMVACLCIWLITRDLIALVPDRMEPAGVGRCGCMAFALAAA